MIVIVSAGLSQPSSSRLLADGFAAALRGRGVEARLYDLREYAHDIVNNLLTGFPSARLREVLDAVAGADGLVAVTPTFNASYNGLFKSFVDVLDEGTLAGTPVVVAATGGTARHSLVLDHALRPLFAYLRAVVLPTGVFAAPEDWAGGAAGGALRARVDRAVEELVAETGRRPARTPADPFALTTSFEQLLGD
jgi:FMN reductase